MTASSFRFLFSFLGVALALSLAACGSAPKGEAKYPTGADREALENPNDIYSEPQSILGKGGISLLGRGDDDAGGGGIGVNSFLWRAALDTVSFMPLASADPFGGVILTDWYAPAETPDERFKINVLIMDKTLRSDGVQVKLFRQVRGKGGDWRDAPASDRTARQLEDSILTRARQLRVAQNGE